MSGFTIGTRGSPLALWQAHEVQKQLAHWLKTDPKTLALAIIRTSGDAIQDRALAEAGGKGLASKIDSFKVMIDRARRTYPNASVFATTLRDTCDLARRLGIGVCMEVNNAWCERGLADTVRRNVDLLRIVQVNDFVVGTLQTPDRAVPGDGGADARQHLGVLGGDVMDLGGIHFHVEQQGRVVRHDLRVGEQLLQGASRFQESARGFHIRRREVRDHRRLWHPFRGCGRRRI